VQVFVKVVQFLHMSVPHILVGLCAFNLKNDVFVGFGDPACVAAVQDGAHRRIPWEETEGLSEVLCLCESSVWLLVPTAQCCQWKVSMLWLSILVYYVVRPWDELRTVWVLMLSLFWAAICKAGLYFKYLCSC
jgi:hypothetical protein